MAAGRLAAAWPPFLCTVAPVYPLQPCIFCPVQSMPSITKYSVFLLHPSSFTAFLRITAFVSFTKPFFHLFWVASSASAKKGRRLCGPIFTRVGELKCPTNRQNQEKKTEKREKKCAWPGPAQASQASEVGACCSPER